MWGRAKKKENVRLDLNPCLWTVGRNLQDFKKAEIRLIKQIYIVHILYIENINFSYYSKGILITLQQCPWLEPWIWSRTQEQNWKADVYLDWLIKIQGHLNQRANNCIHSWINSNYIIKIKSDLSNNWKNFQPNIKL